MAAQTTQIPSLTTRLMDMLGGGSDSQQLAQTMANAITGIGSALAAAGVTFGGNAPAGNLGQLVVDARMPTALGAGAAIDGRAYT
jgi:hypothetical protein